MRKVNSFPQAYVFEGPVGKDDFASIVEVMGKGTVAMLFDKNGGLACLRATDRRDLHMATVDDAVQAIERDLAKKKLVNESKPTVDCFTGGHVSFKDWMQEPSPRQPYAYVGSSAAAPKASLLELAKK